MFFSLLLFVGVPCHDPGHAAHSNRVVTGFVYEDNITFSCNPGFEEDQGNFTVFCNMFGNWTSGLPSCKSITFPFFIICFLRDL